MTSGSLRLGSILNDAWRIEAELGAGGLATVYRATHVRTGTRAAIKVLHSTYAHDEETKERFAREGYAANQIPHPGVVRVLGDGVDGHHPYLVMELVEGQSLKELWKARGKQIPLHDVARIVSDLLDILAVAHERGVVHRDIKPDNVLIASDGRTRLVDFGIARIFGNSSKTATGVILGTPTFMAPEQALARWGDVDGRTDLFAVAATAWTMLTGQFVHQGSTVPEIVVSAATRQVPALRSILPTVPPNVAAVIDRALAFRPASRFPDARAMSSAWLLALAAPDAPSNERVASVTTNRVSPSELRRPSRRAIMFGAAAGLIAAGLGFGAAALVSRSAQPASAKRRASSTASAPAVPPRASASTMVTLPPQTSAPACTPPADLEAFSHVVERILGADVVLEDMSLNQGNGAGATVFTPVHVTSYYYPFGTCQMQQLSRIPLQAGFRIEDGFHTSQVSWPMVRRVVDEASARFARESGVTGSVYFMRVSKIMGILLINVGLQSPLRRQMYSYSMDGNEWPPPR